MDGYPNPKTNLWRGRLYSDARYSVILWLEKELQLAHGKVLNVASGGWDVPYLLLQKNKVIEYKTYDLKFYGDSENTPDIIDDVHNIGNHWNNYWDFVICNQAMMCFENPQKAMDGFFQILKNGGTLLIDCPFNYRWFGAGSIPKEAPKKHEVKDYWRITKDGWELLTKKFSEVEVSHFGPNEWDPYVYMIKAIKRGAQ